MTEKLKNEVMETTPETDTSIAKADELDEWLSGELQSNDDNCLIR